MDDRVTVRTTDGEWDRCFQVFLDGRLAYGDVSHRDASMFAAELRARIESLSAMSDVVADTARALDEGRDEPVNEPVDLRPGDRVLVVSNENRFIGYIEKQMVPGYFWVRIPFPEGDARMTFRRDKLTFLGRVEGEAEEVMGDDPEADEQDEPTFPFKVGDRVRDWCDDVGTVTFVNEDEFRIRYDDRSLGYDGLVRYRHSSLFGLKLTLLPPARPSVTPHPDRPETADGEVPEGWWEDCYGCVFSPDGDTVRYDSGAQHWRVNTSLEPRFFFRRSEAIARIEELLAKGGE